MHQLNVESITVSQKSGQMDQIIVHTPYIADGFPSKVKTSFVTWVSADTAELWLLNVFGSGQQYEYTNRDTDTVETRTTSVSIADSAIAFLGGDDG